MGCRIRLYLREYYRTFVLGWVECADDGVVGSDRYDALIYARIYGSRQKGTHTLHMIEEADHNFTKVSPFSSFKPK